MKTFQQFYEDAASDFRAGQLAYQSSPEAKLSARRADAAERSRTLASDFAARQKEKMHADKEKQEKIRQDIIDRQKK